MDTEPQRRTFLLERCLGKGGFGEVYQARMTTAGGLSTQVAVKLLRADVDPRSQAVERLRDEGRLLAWLNHPTILDVKDLVNLEGRVALVTEFVPGEDLEHCMWGDNALSMRAVLEVVGAVAGALDVAWSSKAPDAEEPLRLVHRDIKPANIRIGRHGYVKLLDFGIARTDVMKREAHTGTNMLIGSVGYLAPERFLGDEGLSASDVFALGCILFEAASQQPLFGELPMIRMSAMSVDRDTYEEYLVKRAAEIEDLDEELLAFILSMLAYAPQDRPSAKQASARCEALAEAFSGISLSRWAKERRWHEHTGPVGPLDGRSITEGTFSVTQDHVLQPEATTPLTNPQTTPQTAPDPVAPPAGDTAATSTRGRGLLAGAAAMTMLGGGVLVLVLVAIVAWSMTGTPAETASEAPVEALEPVEPAVEPEAPVEQPVAEEAPAEAEQAPPPAAPAPSEAASAPAPSPVAPPPAQPAPEPVEEAPAAPQTGTVSVTYKGGKPKVELRGATGSLSPGEVPAGTYQVFADFGDGPTDQGTITVPAGGTASFTCNGMLWSCKL